MEHEFWHQLWQDGRINFHQPDGNARLKTLLPSFDTPPGARLFLPLCGKTGDIGWLLSQGYAVAGIELNRRAIDQLFEDLGVVPTITQNGPLLKYAAPQLDIFVGDFFDLTLAELGQVDAVYDRAALVALPLNLRARYAAHLCHVTQLAPQILMCFDYGGGVDIGPPFSVATTEVQTLYSDHYTLEIQAETDIPGGLKGFTSAIEIAWFLTPRVTAKKTV